MGESAVMDSVAKQRVKDTLLAQVEAELRASRANVTGEDSAASLDPDSSYTVDDQSQADQAGDLGRLIEETGERQAGILSRIDDLDFEPRTEVTPGAIIGFDGDRYVVGVVAAAFECDGITYEGISPDSPIYATLEGLRAGDTFTFDGREHRLDFVA
jgi:transcription elongation GreA/GreB family factor